MITKIKIKDFKILKDAIIDFTTTKNIADKNPDNTNKFKLKNNKYLYTFNLAGIIGANATGKSTFLDAIDIYKQIIVKNFEINRDNCEQIVGLQKQNKFFLFEFLINESIFQHKIEFDWDFKIRSETLTEIKDNFEERTIFNNNEFTFSQLWRIATISKEDKDSFLIDKSDIANINKIFNFIKGIKSADSSEFGWFESHHFMQHVRSILKNESKTKANVKKFESEKNHQKIETLIKTINAIDQNIIDLKYREYENDVVVIVKGKNNQNIQVPFDNISVGTKKFINLLLPLFEKENQVNFYIIDELENSFHPKIIDTILRIFYFNENNRNNVQLLFTTHNPYLFDHIKIHNSCINVSFYQESHNFFKLSNFHENKVKRNDKKFSNNYILELIDSHPSEDSIQAVYDAYVESNK